MILKNHTLKRLFHVRNWIMHEKIQSEIRPIVSEKQQQEEKLDEKLGADLSCFNPEVNAYLAS